MDALPKWRPGVLVPHGSATGSAMAHPEAQDTAAPQGQHAVQQKVHSESQKPQEAMAPTASGEEGGSHQPQPGSPTARRWPAGTLREPMSG